MDSEISDGKRFQKARDLGINLINLLYLIFTNFSAEFFIVKLWMTKKLPIFSQTQKRAQKKAQNAIYYC